MTIPRPRACLLALPLLAAAWTTEADAATTRWQRIAYAPTLNDGLALTGAAFDGQQVLGSIALPFFEIDGQRYELTDAHRFAGPTRGDEAGAVTLSASYRVPVRGGEAVITVTHRLADADLRYADLGEVASTVSFRGPEGAWRFFWRIDPELRGAAGDRAQVFDDAGPRGYWDAPKVEQTVRLDGALEFDRFKLRLNDGPDFAHQTQLRLAPPVAGEAVAYLVRAHDGEWEARPDSLVNGETLQQVSVGERIPQPVLGSDLALWYQADLRGSEGLVGPRLYVAELNGRSTVLEFDRMVSTAAPPTSATAQGKTESLTSAFASGGIAVNQVYTDGVIDDRPGTSAAEIEAIMEANITWQGSQDTPTQWYSWHGIGKTFALPGVLGIMFDYSSYSSDTAYREGSFQLYDEIVSTVELMAELGYPPQELDLFLMWTAAHEIGHSFNQHHEDFWIVETSCFYLDAAIMGYPYFDLGNDLYWTFGPNAGYSLANDAEEYVRPGHGVDFVKAYRAPYLYNTTLKHRNGHYSTGGTGCL